MGTTGGGSPVCVWNDPLTCTVPLRLCSGTSALPVTRTCAVLFCGCQVPAQVPSFSEIKGIGASPFEKLVTTLPVVIGLAQLSTTLMATCVGNPAGTLKPSESRVNTGASTLGMQAP